MFGYWLFGFVCFALGAYLWEVSTGGLAWGVLHRMFGIGCLLYLLLDAKVGVFEIRSLLLCSRGGVPK